MSEIKLIINRRQVVAQPGMTVLEVAERANIRIPTLCYRKGLEPFGSCRLCSVEVKIGKRSRIVASCVYPAEADLTVTTDSEHLHYLRKVLIELLLTKAPGARIIKDLALEYGANATRFKKDATYCILCGICVRYCNEIKKAGAVGFIGRGEAREVIFIPDIAAKECPGCQECFKLCPTNVIESNFLLAQALDFIRMENANY